MHSTFRGGRPFFGAEAAPVSAVRTVEGSVMAAAAPTVERPPAGSRHLVEPDLLAFIDQAPPLSLTTETLPMLRQGFGTRLGLEEDPLAVEAVEVIRRTVPGRGGDPGVGVVLHLPRAPGAPRGAILHMHGGGYVTGNPDALIPAHRRLAATLGCVIASVDYRLAPETRFPGAVEDCYAVLAWLYASADALCIDRSLIGVMGESAGGGLAAALALLARDRGEFGLAFQHLVYPMIDDRTGTSGESNRFAGEFVWTARSNRFGWKCLLGAEPGGPGVSPYAAAARAEDLSGLPPAFINTGALDLFVDEDIAYAHRLVRSGVPTELHVYPGAYHGFHFVAEAGATRRAYADSHDALRRALSGNRPA
ncbi:alpha/beta hydrolase [Sphingomonas canadensis]|uniref:Alpha/beta hydrolase n=1 Tax=Sphingomonas canadensis TaxID=1219257 RepID=A0ABW3H4N8_9SPHN|nr:alpha/beta hydrolase [Sphingomonas canadensis]MCW3834465.1 alpha/beta hydrolase [Sphingomonas canadensis]